MINLKNQGREDAKNLADPIDVHGYGFLIKENQEKNQGDDDAQ